MSVSWRGVRKVSCWCHRGTDEDSVSHGCAGRDFKAAGGCRAAITHVHVAVAGVKGGVLHFGNTLICFLAESYEKRDAPFHVYVDRNQDDS